MKGLTSLSLNFVHAISFNKKRFKIKKTKLVLGVLKILYRLGYIKGFVDYKYSIIVLINNNTRRIRCCKLISTSGRRVYFSTKYKLVLPKGDYIVTTTKGIMTLSNAYDYKIGGEILLYIC